MKTDITDRRGFSLIELLVAVAILGGLAVATSRIFFANLRGTEKTQRLLELRQAGDQALLVMKKKIRAGREARLIDSGGGIVECGNIAVSRDTIEVLRRDPQGAGLASAGTITTQFSCDASRLEIYEVEDATGTVLTDSYITPDYVTVVGCAAVFTCEQTAGFPAKVTISFTLQHNEGEEQDFSSVVSLRNF